MILLLLVIGFILVLILFEIKKTHAAHKRYLLIGKRFPFPSARAGGIAFPLDEELFEACSPTTLYPVFPELQIQYAYRVYSSVNAWFHADAAQSEEELKKKCYELLLSENAGVIYEAMIEANIAVLNGATIEKAYRDYVEKTKDVDLKEPSQEALKKLYESELKRWKEKKHAE